MLSNEDLAKIRYVDEDPRVEGFHPVVVDALFAVSGTADPGERLAAALDALCDEVVATCAPAPTS